MANNNLENQCVLCQKYIKAAYECKGCSKIFCLKHLTEHNQELSAELDRIEDQRNEIQEMISEQTIQTKKCSLFQEIDQWEKKSMELIQKTANECRQSLMKYIDPTSKENLVQITNEIKQLRETDDFNELNLQDLKTKLNQLENQLYQPTNINIREDSTLVKKISFQIVSNIPKNIKWNQRGKTVAGGNQSGSQLNQLYCPMCIEIDGNQTIYIVDQGNNRIVEWEKNATNGKQVIGEVGLLHYPRNLIIDEKK